jgi:hypothetical protein
MKKFSEFIEEGTVVKGTNWKDIVNLFDKIDDAIIEPNGTTIRVRGTKNGKFADTYQDYSDKKIAKEVLKKVQAFIGV